LRQLFGKPEPRQRGAVPLKPVVFGRTGEWWKSFGTEVIPLASWMSVLMKQRSSGGYQGLVHRLVRLSGQIGRWAGTNNPEGAIRFQEQDIACDTGFRPMRQVVWMYCSRFRPVGSISRQTVAEVKRRVSTST